MPGNDRKYIMTLAEMIQGEVNRMCVTNSLSELDTLHEHAQRNLDRLLLMLYDTKFKSEEDM